MLSGLDFPFSHIELSHCPACTHACGGEEAALRHFTYPQAPEMSGEGRAWCLAELAAVDREYATDFAASTPADLARAVVHAWQLHRGDPVQPVLCWSGPGWRVDAGAAWFALEQDGQLFRLRGADRLAGLAVFLGDPAGADGTGVRRGERELVLPGCERPFCLPGIVVTDIRHWLLYAAIGVNRTRLIAKVRTRALDDGLRLNLWLKRTRREWHSLELTGPECLAVRQMLLAAAQSRAGSLHVALANGKRFELVPRGSHYHARCEQGLGWTAKLTRAELVMTARVIDGSWRGCRPG